VVWAPLGAGAGELDVRVHPDDAAAEADHEVLQERVLVDAGLVGCRVHRVVVPALHADDGETRTRAGDDLDVLRVLRRPAMPQHHGGRAVLLGLDHDVGIGAPVGALPGDGHEYGFCDLFIARNAHVHALIGALPRGGGHDVLGDEELAAGRGAGRERGGEELLAALDLIRDAVVLLGGCEQRAELSDGRVLPVDLAAARGAELVGIERTRPL
jgi:hypothetical protein